MNSKELAQLIAELLDSKKAEAIEQLFVADKTTLAEYFVVASGSSNIQVKALADEVEFRLAEVLQRKPERVEGREVGTWILLDYGDVIVHIFHKEQRDYYKLERLWLESPRAEQASTD